MFKLKAEDLYRIEPFLGDSSWSTAQWVDSLHSDFCYGAFVQEQLAAVAVFQNGYDDYTLLNVVTLAPYRGKGLANKLLLECFEKLWQKPCLLEVRISNTSARRLYEKLGFTEDGIRKNYYRTEFGREDAVLMHRPYKA